MLIPATVDLKVYRTGTFSTKLLLWKSLEPLEPFPLGEYEVAVVIDGIMTLTPGSGLVVEENEITIQLTATQTGEISPGSKAHYSVHLTKGSEVVFPMRGTMSCM